MPDMLSLSAHLAELHLDPDEVLALEGNPSGPLWVLLSGELTVIKGGTEVNTVTRPGAVIGEISLLLGHHHGSTVQAATPATLRVAPDGRSFLDSDPAVMRLVAEGLARRVEFVSTYLADLKHQYGDAPGLSMVTDVLARLAVRQDHPARSGSARDPDPEY